MDHGWLSSPTSWLTFHFPFLWRRPLLWRGPLSRKVILLSSRTIFPRRFNRYNDWRGWRNWWPWRRMVNWWRGCSWWRVDRYRLPILCSSTRRLRPSLFPANEEPLWLLLVTLSRGGSHANAEQAIYIIKNPLRFVCPLPMSAWPFHV